LCKAHLFTITEHWTGCDSREARAAYHRVGDELQPDGNYDIPQEQLQSLMQSYYQTEVVVDMQEAERIEVETQLQASCEMWRQERRKRITASNVHKIVSLKPSTKRAPRVKELLYSTFRGNCATKYGLTNENETRKAYVENMQATHPGLVTHHVGLVISTTHPWIAASPDDLVTDPSAPNPYGVAEYKTPLSAKGLTIAAACDSLSNFCLKKDNTTSTISLRRTHQYYYQVQCQLFCTGREWCDFTLSTMSDCYIERIYADRELWARILPKLESFYFNALLPELAYPMFYNGGIREPADY